jgi:tRNA(fMet)-specific endonuclease VapC
MAGKFLLDTNIVVAFFAGEESLHERFRDVGPLVLCVPVLGELFFGATKSNQMATNLQRLADLYNNITVVDCLLNTARVYGYVKHELQSAGRPIPENDLWIAAIAIEHDLILVTRDAHFSVVPNLKTERW